MPIEDLRPSFTSMVRAQADNAESLALIVGAGDLPASTSLFRECARLCRAADKLYHVVELELTVRLCEQERVTAADQAVHA
jgi:hypothetical protein